MAKFQVPQFIEQEPKIIGPLTLKQFGYIASAGVLGLFVFYMFSFFLSLMITVIAAGISLALSFLKIKGQSLPTLLWSFLKFWQRPNKYVWKRKAEVTEIDASSIEKIEEVRKGMSFQNKIKSAAQNIATGSFSLFEGFNKQKTQDKPEDDYEVVTHKTGEKSKAKRVDYTS